MGITEAPFHYLFQLADRKLALRVVFEKVTKEVKFFLLVLSVLSVVSLVERT